MFACLYSRTAPVGTLVQMAESLTPRFEVVSSLVVLDVSGLSRLFGSAREIGEQLRRAGSAVVAGDHYPGNSAGTRPGSSVTSPVSCPVRIALAPTQTAAALLALGRAGLTVVMPGDETAALAVLPADLLGDFDRLRLAVPPAVRTGTAAPTLPQAGEMVDVLPYFQSTLDRASDVARAAHGGGWTHPRNAHAANQTRRALRASGQGSIAPALPRTHARAVLSPASQAALKNIQSLLETLRRWGIKTLGALAALPPGEVYERLGAQGVLWQRLARGDDQSPLVPWVPEEPFEAALDLEWPIEGLEPLSFILGRLLEPLAERLERADRGAAVLHTHLRLVSKTVHARTLQLPSPMRDPKTLRTLVLLDLETNPPSAAIDSVRVLVEPTPARVTQWMLFERARPSPEQVSTLLARLTALMGETHVGSPRLLDSWKPDAFAMTRFAVSDHSPEGRPQGLVSGALPLAADAPDASAPASALRRFRLPVPARVQVRDGRPVRIMTDRRGVAGGAVVQAAGPWRTSGEWWNDGPPPALAGPHAGPDGILQPRVQRTAGSTSGGSSGWDRDEWDVAMADGTVYRLFVERDVGQWFIEGVVD